MSMMTVKDLEQVQATLNQAGYDYQLELNNGQILIVGPSDIYSSEIGVLFSRLLANWVYPRRLGRVFDSAGGFILPNTDLKAPDVSFVRASRLRQGKRYFAEMVPDLVVEIKSQSDKIKPLIEKIQMFLSQGALVGILIDPDLETVTVFRPTGELTQLSNGDVLTIPELFPGLEILIDEIWPPVFDDMDL